MPMHFSITTAAPLNDHSFYVLSSSPTRNYKECKWPTRCNSNNLLIFQSAQHVSGNFLPILRSAGLCFTACGTMNPSCWPVAWSAEALSQCLRVPGHRPITWVHYTTSCKTQSSAPEGRQKITRNMLSWLEYQ